MKNTLAIAYNGGAYGTYLEWAVNTLLTTDQICSPFTKVGNSHGTKLGHMIQNIEQYAQGPKEFSTLKFHPKISKDQSLRHSLNQALEHVSHLVLLYPARSHELLCICNYMTKVYPDVDIYEGVMSYINKDDIIKGYNLDPDTDLKTLPTWIRREHMSLNLFSSWHDQVEWYFPDTWSHPRAMIITTTQLFYDFENILKLISEFSKLKFSRDIKDVLPYHSQMLSLQQNLGKDQLCKDILSSVLNDTEPISWPDLCLTSQAWIQYQLRNQGYELLCNDLNDFPTDTLALKRLIYKPKI